jgi:hypothetical protein
MSVTSRKWQTTTRTFYFQAQREYGDTMQTKDATMAQTWDYNKHVGNYRHKNTL